MCRHFTALSAFALVTALALQSCGGSHGIEDELKMVPGTYMLHVHVEPELGSDLIAFLVEDYPHAALAASLLDEGPLGISVVSIDITSLAPQLMILSKSADRTLAVNNAVAILDIHPDTLESRIDFVTANGRIRGSVAERDGWICVYLGTAPSIVIRQWLELEESSSMIADSALHMVVADGYDLSVLVSGNLIGFVSLLPLGRYVAGWDRIREAITTLQPTAMSLNLAYQDSSHFISISAIVAREDGAISRVSLEIEDSRLYISDIWLVLREWIEGNLR